MGTDSLPGLIDSKPGLDGLSLTTSLMFLRQGTSVGTRRSGHEAVVDMS